MRETKLSQQVLGGLAQQLQFIPQLNEADFLKAQQHPAQISVRLHPLKQSQAFEGTAKVPWCPLGRYLTERPVFTLDPLYHAGAYYVQEASSMFLDHALRQTLPANKRRRILDLCAAPGGKSTLIASLLEPEDLLVANEVIRSRAGILAENILRWGYANSWVSSSDPADFGRLPGYFDVIVADAPCTGSGLYRKDEKAAAEWSEKNVQLCSARQKRILADAWPSLKEDGVLIYATCSFSPEENEAVLDWLKAELGDLETIDLNPPAAWGIVATESLVHGMKGYRFFPQLLQGEGFFIAALRKKAATENFYYPRFHAAHDKHSAQAARDLLTGSFIALTDQRNQPFAIHPEHEADYNLLQDVVYVKQAGTGLGENLYKDWQPGHAVALSVNRRKDLPAIEVDRQSALLFLKKESFELPGSFPKGWFLITHQGLGLGWIKNLSNRFNNYLPRNWRIRMNLDA